jgi:hypothetical protein
VGISDTPAWIVAQANTLASSMDGARSLGCRSNTACAATRNATSSRWLARWTLASPRGAPCRRDS